MEQKEQPIVFDTKLMSEAEFHCLVEMLETMFSSFRDRKQAPP